MEDRVRCTHCRCSHVQKKTLKKESIFNKLDLPIIKLLLRQLNVGQGDTLVYFNCLRCGNKFDPQLNEANQYSRVINHQLCTQI